MNTPYQSRISEKNIFLYSSVSLIGRRTHRKRRMEDIFSHLRRLEEANASLVEHVTAPSIATATCWTHNIILLHSTVTRSPPLQLSIGPYTSVQIIGNTNQLCRISRIQPCRTCIRNCFYALDGDESSKGTSPLRQPAVLPRSSMSPSTLFCIFL